MPEQLLLIWREEPTQLINTAAEGKRPKLFSFNDPELESVQILSNSDAEETIKQDTFDRVAVTQSFARSVLGWDV